MADSRKERLAFDYREMLKIQNRPYLSWIAAKGEMPYVQEYLLNVRLRTYVFSAAKGKCTVGAIRRCTIRVTLWDSYPDTAPYICMLDIPPVFHPEWYSKGTYCPSEPWRREDSLKDHILRMLDGLRYGPSLTDTDTPANFKAQDWYRKNRENTALFPSDQTQLTENTPEEIDAAEKALDPFKEIVDSWTTR